MNETFELEVRANRLDIRRAIDAYLPLLEQTYNLAREQPVVFPSGYQELAQVDANALALAQMAAGDGPVPLAQPEAAAMSAAAVNPEKFGFVVREISTGSLISAATSTVRSPTVSA